jgi:hypothetical protein
VIIAISPTSFLNFLVYTIKSVRGKTDSALLHNQNWDLLREGEASEDLTCGGFTYNTTNTLPKTLEESTNPAFLRPFDWLSNKARNAVVKSESETLL